MPTTTRMFAVIDYLVAQFTASPNLGAANPPIQIFDGPQATQNYAGSSLWVGLSDPQMPPNNPTVAVTNTQQWGALGNRARLEQFDIYCCAQGWDGGSNFTNARGITSAIMGYVEDMIRTDANLGGNVLFVNPGVTGHVLRQAADTRGAFAPCAFRISCKARLVP